MKYYAVAEITVTDPSWIPEYLAKVNPIVEANGGKYLARTSQIIFVEGERSHQTSVIMEFPSQQDAEAFYYGTEYTPLRKARTKGSSSKFYFVAGEDTANT